MCVCLVLVCRIELDGGGQMSNLKRMYYQPTSTSKTQVFFGDLCLDTADSGYVDAVLKVSNATDHEVGASSRKSSADNRWMVEEAGQVTWNAAADV